jgi:hypothetical protein
LLGVAAYASIYVPSLSEGLTEVLTSFSMGNMIRYYFDENNTGKLPSTTLIIVVVAFIFSFLFLSASFRIMKYVSSANFNQGSSLSTGMFSIRVDGLPKKLKDSEYVLISYYVSN